MLDRLMKEIDEYISENRETVFILMVGAFVGIFIPNIIIFLIAGYFIIKIIQRIRRNRGEKNSTKETQQS